MCLFATAGVRANRAFLDAAAFDGVLNSSLTTNVWIRIDEHTGGGVDVDGFSVFFFYFMYVWPHYVSPMGQQTNTVGGSC